MAKKELIRTRSGIGYDMTKLDTRTKRQAGVDAFRWCDDEKFLQTLARDLTKRLARKKQKEAEAAVA